VLESLFREGWVAWIILVLMIVEAALLRVLLRRSGRGSQWAGIAANLAAGACLVAALGAALAGWGWLVLTLILLLSLLAHGLDLWLRLRS
jgi:hypothetical protein